MKLLLLLFWQDKVNLTCMVPGVGERESAAWITPPALNL